MIEWFQLIFDNRDAFEKVTSLPAVYLFFAYIGIFTIKKLLESGFMKRVFSFVRDVLNSVCAPEFAFERSLACREAFATLVGSVFFSVWLGTILFFGTVAWILLESSRNFSSPEGWLRLFLAYTPGLALAALNWNRLELSRKTLRANRLIYIGEQPKYWVRLKRDLGF
jgi:hypothetical protein